MIRACCDLKVWQRAMDLVVEAYRLTKRLPSNERRSLGDQIRRAAVSIPANIAEGNARSHRREYLHYLSIARGSTAELETLLEAAQPVGYLTADELLPAEELLDHVGRMLTRLVSSLADVPLSTSSRVPSPESRKLSSAYECSHPSTSSIHRDAPRASRDPSSSA